MKSYCNLIFTNFLANSHRITGYGELEKKDSDLVEKSIGKPVEKRKLDFIGGGGKDEKLDSKRCYIFRSWGRVGTTIGGNKLNDCANKAAAKSEGRELYLEKTGNSWEQRKSATKRANKFFPLEMDYGDNQVRILRFFFSDCMKLFSWLFF